MNAVKPYGEDWHKLLDEHKTVNRMLDVINWTTGAADDIKLKY